MASDWAETCSQYKEKEESKVTMTQNIEGIPLGWKMRRFGIPQLGDYMLVGIDSIIKADGQRAFYPILAPDNVYNQDLEAVTIPANYEKAGDKVEEWFRVPRKGEMVMNARASQKYLSGEKSGVYGENDTLTNSYYSDPRRIILRHIKPKTKRVLVVEYENPSDYMIETFRLLVTNDRAFSKRTAKVEERPL